MKNPPNKLTWFDWMFGIEMGLIAGLFGSLIWRLSGAPYWLGVYLTITTALTLGVLYVCVAKRQW